MLIAGAMQAILDAFGSLTFFIDKGVYFFAKAIYDVFMFIADARLLDNGIAMNLTRRIYAILSIFMLFVLGYNLLLYIIDPDKMTDKENGMGSIIKNVVIALVIIILLPTLFNRLYSLQSMVLKSGVIENLFLGGYTEVSNEELGNTSNPSASSGIEKGVNIMIANTYAAFLLPEDENNFTVLQCDDGESENTYTEYCEAWKNVKETGNIAYFSTFVGNDDYRFYPFISTVVGIVLIFFMLSFCINLAIRAAKMVVLQLIAPIPLVLEILPNKKGLRQGWIKELISVYLQVFIYMAMIFLVIFLISMVPNVVHKIIATNFKDVAKSAGTFTMLVAVLIISYGLLLFGKEAPGYVLKLLGIESTGILKSAGLRAYRMAGAGLAAIGTGSTIGLRNAYAAGKNIKNAWNDDKLSPDQRGDKVLKAAGKGMLGMGGIFTGAVRGAYGNRTGGLKGLKANTSGAIQKTQSSIDKIAQRASGAEYRLDEAVKGNLNPYDSHPIRDFLEYGMTETADKEISDLSSAVGSVEDFGKDDATYKAIDKKFNDELRDAAVNSNTNWSTAYKEWKDTQPADATEFDFANEVLSNPTKVDGHGNSYSALQNAAKAYKAKEDQRELINNQKTDQYRNKAIEYITNIKNNPNINLSRPEYTKLNELVGKVEKLFENDDINSRKLKRAKDSGHEVYRALAAIDKEVKSIKTDKEAEGLGRRRPKKEN